MHYVDLHSHVLWGVDDGAQHRNDSLEMLRLLREIGFSTVYATPHQKDGAFTPSAELIAERHSDVQTLLSEAGYDITLRIGAENFWDELFLRRAQRGEQPTYRDTPALPSSASPAFLVELPVLQVPLRLLDQLFALRLQGRLPVLAHPERYVPLWSHWDRLEQLGRCAALVVDLPALDGAHGPERAKAARHIVQEGLCHAVASDLHHADDSRATAAGIAWIRKRLGAARVKALLQDGPRQIVAGELPDLPG